MFSRYPHSQRLTNQQNIKDLKMNITIKQEKEINKCVQVAVLTNMMNIAMGPPTKDMSPTVRAEMMHKKMDDLCNKATQHIKEMLENDNAKVQTPAEFMEATMSDDAPESNLTASDVLLKSYTHKLTPEKAVEKVTRDLGFITFSHFKRVIAKIEEAKMKPMVVAHVRHN